MHEHERDELQIHLPQYWSVAREFCSQPLRLLSSILEYDFFSFILQFIINGIFTRDSKIPHRNAYEYLNKWPQLLLTDCRAGWQTAGLVSFAGWLAGYLAARFVYSHQPPLQIKQSGKNIKIVLLVFTQYVFVSVVISFKNIIIYFTKLAIAPIEVVEIVARNVIWHFNCLIRSL